MPFEEGVEHLSNFIDQIKLLIADMNSDYVNIILNETEYTSIRLILEHAFMGSWSALNRLYAGYKKLHDYCETNHVCLHSVPVNLIVDFFASQLIPFDLYHSQEHYLPDIVHNVFSLGIDTHLQALQSPPTLPKAAIDSVCNYLFDLASYTVLPPDFCCHSLITKCGDFTIDLDIAQPGLDSRSRIENITNDRTCIRCHVNLVSVGLTDTDEIKRKLSCECLMRKIDVDSNIYARHEDFFLRCLTQVRAGMLIRWLMLVKYRSQKRENVLMGCSCDDHKFLFNRHYSQYISLLQRYNVVNR